MPALLSIVGRKGSGKSKVLTELISVLSRRKLRLGVLKHLARDDFEIDQPEKDTFRYRAEGAEKVVLAGRKRLALFANLQEEIPFEELLSFFEGFDLVFLEDYFREGVLKIEVHRKELGDLLLVHQLKDVLAICSDGVKRPEVPHFSTEAIPELALFIEESLIKRESEAGL